MNQRFSNSLVLEVKEQIINKLILKLKRARPHVKKG